jgi:hypothetical protein
MFYARENRPETNLYQAPDWPKSLLFPPFPKRETPRFY